MNIQIGKLRGMSEGLESKLQQRGLRNSGQLLEAARTPAGRADLADSLGVKPEVILELANRADLARVKGIAGVFSDLLEQAGVDTIPELANRNADNLYAKLVEVNAEARLAGRAPTKNEVASWVSQAKALPRALEY
jgi:hypothetical protein